MSMRWKSFLAAGALGLAALSFVPAANAQTTTAGAIQGTVTDEATGVPMLLVTVVATSPALQGQASEFTDASGQYYLSNLPPGNYSLVFVYGDAKVKRENVQVSIGKVTNANAKINQQATEIVTIKERAPAIDAGSTKQGTTLQQDYMKNVPSRGRTYEGVLGAAGGSQNDLYGVSFSGSTSVENSYVVDGVNTTGVRFGGVQSPVLNNFIQEIEVITGGYNAEFGRSTGGVVNVVTKTGSNEFHGSVWANVTPLEATRDRIQQAGTVFSANRALDTDLDFGFDVGGPIIKDKLWFYVGFAPFIQRATVTRFAGTRVDRNRRFVSYDPATCADKNADGTCDRDNNPQTSPAAGCELRAANGAACESDGFADLDSANTPIIEEIERRDRTDTNTQYQFTGKVNFAVSPDHQGQVSFIGAPQNARTILCATYNGSSTACELDTSTFTADAALKWTSKFNNNKTQVDAVLGWHRQTVNVSAIRPNLESSGRPANEEPFVDFRNSQTAAIGGLLNSRLNNPQSIAVGHNWDENESDAVMNACRDESAGNLSVDAFPRIANCPSTRYFLGGPGITDEILEKRMTGKLTLTQRVKALGHHQFKVGADAEINQIADVRQRSGGHTVQFNTRGAINTWRTRGFARPDPAGDDVCYNFGDPVRCTLIDKLPVNSTTFNWAAFVQDSWSILPNLTINAGLRYEEQRLGYAKEQQGVIDPLTNEPVGSTALKLGSLIAPRVGVIYDWTKEGRSKIYANWGRFYESVPMDMNERAFGGENEIFQEWNAATQCGGFTPDPNDPNGLRLPSLFQNCPRSGTMQAPAFVPGSAFTAIGNPEKKTPVGLAVVVPGTGAQSLDELVVGAEYEVLEDLRLGVSYQNRRMNQVIEDVSTDGGTTYYFSNPGTFSASEEQSMLEQIQMAGPTSDLGLALIGRLQDYRAIRQFDKPIRDYNAVQVTVAKRFSRNFMVQGSYTYSVLEGNYPGLFQPDTTQLDPNLTSQYDLFELLGNRYGRLPADRPHSFKLDGYYTFDLEKAGRVTTGLRLRALSGRPVEALAAHAAYGRQESFILPRGSSGRVEFQTQADLHVAYARKIGDTDVEVYVELFNLLNNQYETNKDNEYTLQFVHPIIGGSQDDLQHAKQALVTGAPITRNLNWRNTTVKAVPLTGRVGLTVSF